MSGSVDLALRRARARALTAGAGVVWRFRNAWWGLGASPRDRVRRAPAAEPPSNGAAARRPPEHPAARRAALAAEGRERFGGKRVLFVLPIAERGGGANVVLTEARALARMGVHASVLNVPTLERSFGASYPEPGVPVLWAYPDGVSRAARGFDAVVATTNTSVPWLSALTGSGTALAYYVQDYEPWFYPEGSFKRRNAFASYTLVPGVRLVTKTRWNREVLLRETGAEAAVLGASFDVDAFRPRNTELPDAPFRVAAMVRPTTPRRAPERTLRALSRTAQALGSAVAIVTFGVAPTDPDYLALPRGFPHVHRGLLDDRALAELLGSVHAFADFSDYQAMGLTALEAMGSGATAVVPREGGASDFATNERNALVVDTRSEEACVEALLRLAKDVDLRRRLMSAAPAVADVHVPEAPALALLEALFP